MLNNNELDRDVEVYTGDTLRALVKVALEEKEASSGNGSPAKFLQEDVELNVKSLKEHCIEVAKHGKVEAYYNFNNLPQELLIAVANEFRKVYPDVMIIKELGRNRLVINWSGNNEC